MLPVTVILLLRGQRSLSKGNRQIDLTWFEQHSMWTLRLWYFSAATASHKLWDKTVDPHERNRNHNFAHYLFIYRRHRRHSLPRGGTVFKDRRRGYALIVKRLIIVGVRFLRGFIGIPRHGRWNSCVANDALIFARGRARGARPFRGQVVRAMSICTGRLMRRVIRPGRTRFPSTELLRRNLSEPWIINARDTAGHATQEHRLVTRNVRRETSDGCADYGGY